MIFEETGEPADILHIRDIPDHTPGAGDILVRVLLSPVHPADLHVMRGRFGRTPALPISPGIECVGVVDALGEDADGPKPGTWVVLLDVWANWRELVVAPAERVIPVPDAASDQDAAQAMINPVTALVLTTVEHRRPPGRVARPDRRRIHRRPPFGAACAKRGISHAQLGAAVRAGR